MVCVKLINPDPNLETGSEDLLLMAEDDPCAIAYAKRSHACQIHGDFVHQAPERLHPTAFSWPFKMWGMDVIGSISPLTSRLYRFILTITDYFSKWAEAVPLKEVKTPNVIKFIMHHVLYHFGAP